MTKWLPIDGGRKVCCEAIFQLLLPANAARQLCEVGESNTCPGRLCQPEVLWVIDQNGPETVPGTPIPRGNEWHLSAGTKDARNPHMAPVPQDKAPLNCLSITRGDGIGERVRVEINLAVV